MNDIWLASDSVAFFWLRSIFHSALVHIIVVARLKNRAVMFSGLTNQVTSWIGNTKPQQQPDESSTTKEIGEAETEKPTSPSNPKSGKDMLTNVKSQLGGLGDWLGSTMPKLKKGDEAVPENAINPEESPAPVTDDNKPEEKGEDDRSSSTGGADSGPQSLAETPTEEQNLQFGDVSSKAIAGAKSLTSFFYSAVNKAGQTVSVASAKIKESVEKNSILGEFNREQEAFLKSQNQNAASPLPPWSGYANEEQLKEECLDLSKDKRNFLKSPPAGVNFQFDYNIAHPIAVAIMEHDPNLEKMRYELVPKVLSEENFWRNYFYRVNLICQANELSLSGNDGSAPAGEQKEWERELESELQDYEVVTDNKSSNKNENWEQEIDEILGDVADLK